MCIILALVIFIFKLKYLMKYEKSDRIYGENVLVVHNALS